MIKKIFPIILPMFLFISCIQSNYMKKTDFLPVTLESMTDTVKVGQPVTIRLSAVAPNGCWKNLKHFMSQSTDNHILFVAKGDFESTGACTDNIVQKDSVFNFILTKAGKYYIQMNQSPNTITNDSLEIIN